MIYAKYTLYYAEDVCKKHLKAPDMLIQCIFVYIILYFNTLYIARKFLWVNTKYYESFNFKIKIDSNYCVNFIKF